MHLSETHKVFSSRTLLFLLVHWYRSLHRTEPALELWKRVKLQRVLGAGGAVGGNEAAGVGPQDAAQRAGPSRASGPHRAELTAEDSCFWNHSRERNPTRVQQDTRKERSGVRV